MHERIELLPVFSLVFSFAKIWGSSPMNILLAEQASGLVHGNHLVTYGSTVGLQLDI
jgi:hypothetical protein